MNPPITVALPVHRADGSLREAVASISRQSFTDIEILFVLNGSDRETRELVHGLAGAEPRARVMELPEANLAAALNAALEASRSPLIARMDADDACRPERLAVQMAALEDRPGLAGVGCAWELADGEGRVLATVRPPTDPARVRWRLLLGNFLAHGSMLLRREAVLAVGGYDTRCVRSQDYDLWLRLCGRVEPVSNRLGLGCVPEVLYTHRVREPLDPTRVTGEQAAVAAPAMVGGWSSLPPSPDRGALGEAVAEAMRAGTDPGECLAAIERVLDEQGASREGLTAWLWAQWARPAGSRRAIEAGRLARLREVGGELRAEGVLRVWLWGAGDHTRWVLEHAGELGVAVAGVVDDARAGEERFGFIVARPDAVRAGETVVLSSDWHEGAMWESSAPHRERGVRVLRFYGRG